MLIGSKLDLAENRAVEREDGIKTAKNHNLSAFIELSSKTGQNIEEAFKMMAEILFETYGDD